MRVTFIVDGFDYVPEKEQERLKDVLHSLGCILLTHEDFEVTSVSCYKRFNYCELDFQSRRGVDNEKKKKKKA